MSTPKPDKSKKSKAKKPSRTDKTAEKMAFVREKINERARVSAIKKAFAEKFKTTPRAAERFITDVYAEIRLESGRKPEEHRQDSYAFWTARVSDMNLPMRDRMRAQEQLDKILGVHAPIKTAATDVSGKDVVPERRLTLAELDEALNLLDADKEESPPCAASPQ